MAAAGKWGSVYWQDTGERTAFAFLTTFIPLWVAAGNVVHGLDFVNALELSGSAAGLVLLKCLSSNLSQGKHAAPTASVLGVTSTKS